MGGLRRLGRRLRPSLDVIDRKLVDNENIMKTGMRIDQSFLVLAVVGSADEIQEILVKGRVLHVEYSLPKRTWGQVSG